ncbi:hypothetical protein J3E69DRAFT_335351 [Trichoderma sp. SZMC 28015]
MLNLYAENSQCKHIYLAACHDGGYISDLTTYIGNKDRFTLVNSPGVRFHKEYLKLGMGIEELPGVFHSLPLDATFVSNSSRSGPLRPLLKSRRRWFHGHHQVNQTIQWKANANPVSFFRLGNANTVEIAPTCMLAATSTTWTCRAAAMQEASSVTPSNGLRFFPPRTVCFIQSFNSFCPFRVIRSFSLFFLHPWRSQEQRHACGVAKELPKKYHRLLVFARY